MLNERKMRQTLTELGLENTELVIRDPDTGKESRRLQGEELRRVVEFLGKLEELVKVVQRRGIDFAEFLGRRDSLGRLPLYRIIVEGEEHFFHSAAERDQFLRENHFVVEDAEMNKPPAAAAVPAGNGHPVEQGPRLQKNHELHEVKEMEKLFSQLEQHGLSIDDYFLTQEESVSGEKLAHQLRPGRMKSKCTTSPASPRSFPRSTRSARAASRSSASRAWAR